MRLEQALSSKWMTQRELMESFKIDLARRTVSGVNAAIWLIACICLLSACGKKPPNMATECRYFDAETYGYNLAQQQRPMKDFIGFRQGCEAIQIAEPYEHNEFVKGYERGRDEFCSVDNAVKLASSRRYNLSVDGPPEICTLEQGKRFWSAYQTQRSGLYPYIVRSPTTHTGGDKAYAKDYCAGNNCEESFDNGQVQPGVNSVSQSGINKVQKLEQLKKADKEPWWRKHSEQPQWDLPDL